MDCKDIRKKFSDYIDHNVSEKEKRDIQEHLDICIKCSNELEMMKKTLEMVRNLPALSAPDGLIDHVIEKIHQHQSKKVKITLVLSKIAFAEIIALVIIMGLKHYFPEKNVTIPVQEKQQLIAGKSESGETKIQPSEIIKKTEKKSQLALKTQQSYSPIQHEREDQLITIEIAKKSPEKEVFVPLFQAEKEFGDRTTEKTLKEEKSIAQPSLQTKRFVANEQINVESEILKQITMEEGKILSDKEISDTEVSRIITVEIKKENYRNMIEQLNQKFEIKNYSSIKDIESPETSIKIQFQIFK